MPISNASSGVTSPDLKKGLFIDLDKLPDGAIIRAPKDGDTFTKFGGGTKKLKDYFIDKKIPVKERDPIPVIASGNEVLVIFGLEISENVKITEKTTNFCIAYLK
jgi:tRNA(Ile)-lysidine synthase